MTHEFDHGVLYQGDCLDIMPNLPEKSVDMILADLPYGTTQNKWDIIIPLKSLWKQYERIIKDNGAIILTASEPFTSLLVVSKYKLFKYDLMWDKISTTGFLNANRMPLRQHESILVFYKRLPTYNPVMIKRGNPRNKGSYNKAIGNGDSCYGHFENIKNFNNTYYPTSVVRFSNARQSAKIHQTQKPVELFEYLIRTYTNEGETVLDNVIGSGTTAVAAYRTGRRWIGIEKDPEIYQTCVERITKDTQQLNLITTANKKNEADF